MPDWLGPFLLGMATGAMLTWNVHARLLKDRLRVHAWREPGGRVLFWTLNFGRALIASGPKDYLDKRKKRIEDAIDGRYEGR